MHFWKGERLENIKIPTSQVVGRISLLGITRAGSMGIISALSAPQKVYANIH